MQTIMLIKKNKLSIAIENNNTTSYNNQASKK